MSLTESEGMSTFFLQYAFCGAFLPTYIKGDCSLFSGFIFAKKQIIAKYFLTRWW